MSKSFESVKALELKINTLFSGKISRNVFKFYADRFSVPKDVVCQYLKRRTATNYNTITSDLDHKLSLPYMFISVIKYLGLIFLMACFSKTLKVKRKSYSLLIDDIQHQSEIDKWSKLESHFNCKKTIFISRSKIVKANNNNVIYRLVSRGYDKKWIAKNILSLISSDIIFLIWYSLKLKINLVYLHSFFINDYLYYRSLFRLCNAKYMIQDRNLGRTNALKNYLFKDSGGIVSSCIQKNIAQHDGFALYYDIDLFFSYGVKTADDILSLGGRVNQTIPVGSYAMENSSLESKWVIKECYDIDIIYIGINAISSTRTDWSGYYSSITWLARLAKASNNLKIVIKHHPTWISDPRELKIIKDTGIEYLDNKLDSYDAASKSEIIITYGSSMGYELMGNGSNIIFLDPGECNPFINNFVHSDGNVISFYEDLESLVLKKRLSELKPKNLNPSDYCIVDGVVSKRIFDSLNSYEPKKNMLGNGML
jgi:hypothetical protein